MHVGIAKIAPGLAFVFGVAAAALAIHSWGVRGGTAAPGADVRITAARSDSIAATTEGSLARNDLTPSAASHGLRGSLELFNATGRPLSVRLRADTPDADLDHVLFLRLSSGGARLFSGPLAALHEGSASVTLASHARTPVSVQAGIPASAGTGYQARAEAVSLSFLTKPAVA
jgi:hypothetical protein